MIGPGLLFIALAGVFAFFIGKSLTTGVAELRGGSVTKEDSPTMFKVYLATQIATFGFLLWMAATSVW
jgi:hypothetical protein